MGGQRLSAVFVDANVLYSKTLRDWLGLLYTDDVVASFQVFWSEDVMAEAIYHLRKQHPDWDGGKLSRIRDLIAGTFEVGRVTDFTVDDTYSGGDEGDAHVHSAAVACGADYLLTCNVRDFAGDDPHQLPYEVITPDDFFVVVGTSQPELVNSCISRQIQHYQEHAGGIDLDGALGRAGCPRFAELVLAQLRLRALSPG